MNLKELMETRRKKKFIGLDNMNHELITELELNGAFKDYTYKGKTRNNGEILRSIIDADNPTDKQVKFAQYIILKDVFDTLDRLLNNPISIVEVDKPHCDTCTCFNETEDNELSDKAKLLQQSNEKLESEIDEDDLPF